MKLVIVDYGMGNITSIISALNYIGQDNVVVSNDTHILNDADKLILPGVGNYATAVAKIRKLNLDTQIEELVINQKKPILGICLGMQLLGCSSTESGYNSGLSLVKGVVDKFCKSELKVPHVGYNQVMPSQQSRLYRGIEGNPDFYFTHSFKMLSESSIGQSFCCYGEDFIASFELDNVAGVQFHPELSQKNGLQLLKNFIELF
jgi:glutamine amidotransferase